MKKKIIASLLIYPLLIQTILMNAGCMSYYPVKGENELNDYKNYKDKILVKLKDDNEVEVIPHNLLYFDKNSKFIYAEGEEYDRSSGRSSHFRGIISPYKIDSEDNQLTDLKKFRMKIISTSEIDSEKIIENKSNIYHLFWMKNGKRLSIKDRDLILITDSLRNFWVAMDPYKKEFNKINDSNIERIETQKIDWVKTSLFTPIAIAFGIGMVIMIIQDIRGRWNYLYGY